VSKKYFALEKTTGAIDGIYFDKERASEMVSAMSEQYPDSTWVLCELLDKQVGYSQFSIHHQNNPMNDILHSIYGNAWLKIPSKGTTTVSCGDYVIENDVLAFNQSNTAFDALTDYAFGGDKQAALEYLKAL
jgi:hypothetical protein